MEKNEKAESIDHGVGQFAAEASAAVDDVSLLFDVKDYPEEMHELIIECNRRIDEANSKYRIAKFREDMFAKGMKAGMYFCTFDRDENMLSFEFNEETRQMLGYDGLEDLPNEFESWVKTLVPEERDAIVKLFWDSVRIHRDLPDITHATYRMQKKDGSLIWVTGAGRFIRRPDDGSLEIYMGCYRDITAQQELEEYLKIIEALGKVFNFSLFIDVTDMSYRMISTNEYVEAVPKDPDAIVFLKNIVAASVAESFRQRLYDWLDKDAILHVAHILRLGSVARSDNGLALLHILQVADSLHLGDGRRLHAKVALPQVAMHIALKSHQVDVFNKLILNDIALDALHCLGLSLAQDNEFVAVAVELGDSLEQHIDALVAVKTAMEHYERLLRRHLQLLAQVGHGSLSTGVGVEHTLRDHARERLLDARCGMSKKMVVGKLRHKDIVVDVAVHLL